MSQFNVSAITSNDNTIYPNEVSDVVVRSKYYDYIKTSLSKLSKKCLEIVGDNKDPKKQLQQLLSMHPSLLLSLSQSEKGGNIQRIIKHCEFALKDILIDKMEYSQDILIASQILNRNSNKKLVFNEWSTSVAGGSTQLAIEEGYFLKRNDLFLINKNNEIVFSEVLPFIERHYNVKSAIPYLLSVLKELGIIDPTTIGATGMSWSDVKKAFERKFPCEKLKLYLDAKNHLVESESYLKIISNEMN